MSVTLVILWFGIFFEYLRDLSKHSLIVGNNNAFGANQDYPMNSSQVGAYKQTEVELVNFHKMVAANVTVRERGMKYGDVNAS